MLLSYPNAGLKSPLESSTQSRRRPRHQPFAQYRALVLPHGLDSRPQRRLGLEKSPSMRASVGMEVVAMSIEGKLPLLSNIYLVSTSDACVGAAFLTTHQEMAGLPLLQRYPLGA